MLPVSLLTSYLVLLTSYFLLLTSGNPGEVLAF